MGAASIRIRDFTRINHLEFHGLKVDEDPQEIVDEVYKIVKIMGVSPVELAAYQLKGTFLDHFFPVEMRETKVLELINLHQGNMCEKEYILKFTQLAKYSPTMVADSRARMKKKIKERARKSKRERTGDGDFSHSRSGGHSRSQFQKKFSSQGSSNVSAPKLNKDKLSNPKPQLSGGSVSFIPVCQKDIDCETPTLEVVPIVKEFREVYPNDLLGIQVDPKKIEAFTQKKVKFLWSKACEKSFKELKDMLTLDIIVTLLEGSHGSVVYYDASQIGRGCVLMQHKKVIAYALRQLKGGKKDLVLMFMVWPNWVFALLIPLKVV
ncbi:hypothetical protein MTR67_023937 [Solanum verrucosum]|uniref:Reverse transcriptase/retrotransposon-derived protein RNase H-like domain-containing protein n=1 Tax=Solanum verrucosum TaxID=315347 RepID=A0AAF0QUH3_SOLVR|nr:hypothetical protein MTR67_023937 [Solanum verrucosum]